MYMYRRNAISPFYIKLCSKTMSTNNTFTNINRHFIIAVITGSTDGIGKAYAFEVNEVV